MQEFDFIGLLKDTQAQTQTRQQQADAQKIAAKAQEDLLGELIQYCQTNKIKTYIDQEENQPAEDVPAEEKEQV